MPDFRPLGLNLTLGLAAFLGASSAGAQSLGEITALTPTARTVATGSVASVPLSEFFKIAGKTRDANPVVKFATTSGNIYVELLAGDAPNGAPATVANFLNYMNSGRYTNTFIHRSMPNFVVQGGGFRVNGDQTSGAGAGLANLEVITTDPAVVNEYNVVRSNLRGTMAMAKLGGDPNSATSQWFWNLANNAGNLDNQNGGFTVFARTFGYSMTVVDTIAGLPTFTAAGAGVFNQDIEGALTNLPLYNNTSAALGAASTFVTITSVSEASVFAADGGSAGIISVTPVAPPAGLGTVTFADASAKFTPTSAGTYALVLLGSSAGGTITQLSTVQVTVIDPATFGKQPDAATVTYGNNASFTVTSVGGNSPVLRWQRSTDSGSTWTDLSNDATFSNTTTATLTVTKPAVALSGQQFRLKASVSGLADAFTNAATLTVNRPTLVADVRDAIRFEGEPNPVFVIDYSGFISGESVADITVPTASTTANVDSPAGSYPITLTGGSAANYQLSLVGGTLTVSQVFQTASTLDVAFDGSAADAVAPNLPSLEVATTYGADRRSVANHALLLDGGGSMVNYAQRTLAANFGVAVWIAPAATEASVTAEQPIVVFGSDRFALVRNPVNGVVSARVSTGTDNAPTAHAVTATITAPANTWTHIGVVYAAAEVGGTLRIYVDGTLCGTTSVNASRTIFSDTLSVGSYGSGVFIGAIDDLHVIDSVPTDAMLAEVSESGDYAPGGGVFAGETTVSVNERSSWFGSYYRGWQFPWVHHSQHGWMYVVSARSGVYLYDPGIFSGSALGWLYTTPTAYPHVYSYRLNAWLYYTQAGNPSRRWFYNHSTGQWVRAELK